ncbi:PorT family protein [Chryseobacterium soli]|nr:PorT family protein [Chryseobacterium soli]
MFANIPIAGKFSLQPELSYNQIGSKIEIDTRCDLPGTVVRMKNNGSLPLGYVSLPVMLQYNLLPNLYVEAGPEFGLLLGGKTKDSWTETRTSGNNISITSRRSNIKIIKDYYNTFNMGIGIGAGYLFISNFGVTARFTAGLTDIYKHNTGDAVRNNTFQVGVAYKFKMHIKKIVIKNSFSNKAALLYKN